MDVAVPRRLKPPRNHENEAWIGTSKFVTFPFVLLPMYFICTSKLVPFQIVPPLTHFADELERYKSECSHAFCSRTPLLA
jgi:hypothetical protein